MPGETYQFGVAFWDPVELESGWTDPGHYMTGCGSDWIDLELVASSSEATNGESTTNGDKATNGDYSGVRYYSLSALGWFAVVAISRTIGTLI